MDYIPTIGLEVHVQLNTKTKVFCSCSNSFGSQPNSNICPVCLALPGALPVFNQEVLYKAVLAGITLNCSIHSESIFDRKNYFYPDLPKGYQISQLYKPYATCGLLSIEYANKENKLITKKVGITRIHIEEDAGKLIHSEDTTLIESYVDLNRAGTPLIEIVSEPELESSEEAYQYLVKLKSILEYIEVSDCNMEQGSLRCDANISVRLEGSSKLGTRAEIKNLNSFKGVRSAIEYEIERQISILESDNKVIQETRLWDATQNRTYSMRSKEEAFDYRYFPDPDLVSVILEQDTIDAMYKELPELAEEKEKRFIQEYSLPVYDAKVLTVDRMIADYFEKVVQLGGTSKKVSNWIMTEVMAVQKESEKSIYDIISAEHLSDIIKNIENGKISSKIAKQVFQDVIETGRSPNEIIEKKGLGQISDTSEIESIIDSILSDNEQSVTDYKNGRERALKFLIGQIMKETKGRANPQLVNEMLLQKLT